MPRYSHLIDKINSLVEEKKNLPSLSAEKKNRLWEKFRLEWNYNSNHIEGNTLTYGETQLLILFGKTTGDHTIREYNEMKAHDLALRKVGEFAEDKSRSITEADIRSLNKIILVEEFWAPAQTADGQPTQKLIKPGEYKSTPNSVRQVNGEMFHFASPEETPAKMQELVSWLTNEEKSGNLHPVEVAAKLHYDFISIHPFDDCNGRTARLLMNYVLLRYDYPPVIIKSKDKKGYLDALNKADVGDREAFTEYIAKELIWSLELSIKAAKGENIEEPDDLDKEIELALKRNQQSVEKAKVKSIALLEQLVKDEILPFLSQLVEKHLKFNSLFVSNKIIIIHESRFSPDIKSPNDLESSINSILDAYRDYEAENFASLTVELQLQIAHSQFKARPSTHIHDVQKLSIKFEPLQYSITFGNDVIRKQYGERINESESRQIIRESIEPLLKMN